VNGISFTGRTARGVTLFRVGEAERVVSVTRLRDVEGEAGDDGDEGDERGDGEDVCAAEEAGAEEAVGEETPAAEAEAAESEPEQPEAEE
jgi:DNA gyrase subunit A